MHLEYPAEVLPGRPSGKEVVAPVCSAGVRYEADTGLSPLIGRDTEPDKGGPFADASPSTGLLVT